MTNNLQYNVFLSHSSKDKTVVRDIAERLRQDGLQVWFDEWVIKPGDSIPHKIEQGLEQSCILLLFMSENAFGSDWAELESQTFRFQDPLNKEGHFISIRLDDTPVKGSLAQLAYIDWRDEDHRQEEYGKLIERVQTLSKAKPAHEKQHEKIQSKNQSIKAANARNAYIERLEKNIDERIKSSLHYKAFTDDAANDNTFIDDVLLQEDKKAVYLSQSEHRDSNNQSFNSYKKVFKDKEFIKRRFLLLGDPGTGKSTTLLHIAKQLIKEAKENENAPIPLFFSLSTFKQTRQKSESKSSKFPIPFTHTNKATEQCPVEEWLINLISEYPKMSKEIARQWIQEERVALLLDGLDEMEEESRSYFIKAFNSYIDKYRDYDDKDRPIVVCSRLVEYNLLKENKETKIKLNNAVIIKELSKKQIIDYLQKNKAEGLLNTLLSNDELFELARNPLILSMLVLSYPGKSSLKYHQTSQCLKPNIYCSHPM